MMNKEKEILKEIINYYGVNNQLVLCMEECAELIKALEEESNILEELVDVEIMIDKLNIILGNPMNFCEEKLNDIITTNIIDKKHYKCVFADLIQGISKYMRTKKPEKVLQQLHDSMLEIEFLKTAFDDKDIKEMRNYKINRIKARMERGEKEYF